MKEALEGLIERQLPLPGVAAWSARLADRSLMSHCYTNWFTSSQVEQALTRLALAADSLGHHRIQPERLCWTFEHARIHLALRGDGACLAFFVENRADFPSAALETVLQEFMTLPPA